MTPAGPTAAIMPSSMITAASSMRPSLLKSMPAWGASVSQVTTVLARTVHEFASATSPSIRRDGTHALYVARQGLALEELSEYRDRFGGVLIDEPVAGVFEDDDGDVVG